MKIAIIGAGFTGLAAAFKLSRSSKHEITVFESKNSAGGLAGTFKLPSWKYSVEKHYHHWFTNDKYALGLIKDLGLSGKLIFPRTVTSILYNNKRLPFNSPMDLLNFNPLSFPERIIAGISLLYLKFLPVSFALSLEKQTAYDWLVKYFGKRGFEILWKPLFEGKFNGFAHQVNMTWFWARIKKRTMRLGYLEGGYAVLIEKMVEEIRKRGGEILLSSPFDPKDISKFDKVIATLPTDNFLKMFPRFPVDYKDNLKKIPHLHALNLMIITKKKFLEKEYWLNINESDYPFIGVIQHTNLVDSKNFGRQHITYIANYLPQDHPYLKMNREELFQTYLPYLKKINQSFNFKLETLNLELFSDYFAQPVFTVNYSRIKPDFTTPIKNVYLANMDMVYPWDRGTNYAIELGYKVAEFIG